VDAAEGSSLPPRGRIRARLPSTEYARDDERALRAGLPGSRAAVLSDRSLSYGVGVPEAAPFVQRARQAGIATVRRSTGGTGLLHEPGDLAWSIVLPRGDPRVGRQFPRAFGRFGRGAVRFLADLGIEAEWVDAPGLDPGYCTLSARGAVLASRGRILGGAAQHLTGAALLHHGAISLTVDRPTIDRLFDLAPGGPSVRLSGLRSLGIGDEPEQLATTLARRLEEDLFPVPSR